ncbi:MAG: DUF4440 domain-containing protein [bacterium]|nr:DUF4440 domain-containing protein [bacterium]
MDDLNKTFYELEMSLLEPEVRSSRERLDKLLTDDFMEFGSSGSLYKKADTLENLSTSTDKVVFIVSDFQARELSENFVLTTFKTERTINDTDKVTSLRSSIWKKTNDNWQMFFHQGTPVKR